MARTTYFLSFLPYYCPNFYPFSLNTNKKYDRIRRVQIKTIANLIKQKMIQLYLSWINLFDFFSFSPQASPFNCTLMFQDGRNSSPDGERILHQPFLHLVVAKESEQKRWSGYQRDRARGERNGVRHASNWHATLTCPHVPQLPGNPLTPSPTQTPQQGAIHARGHAPVKISQPTSALDYQIICNVLDWKLHASLFEHQPYLYETHPHTDTHALFTAHFHPSFIYQLIRRKKSTFKMTSKSFKPLMDNIFPEKF